MNKILIVDNSTAWIENYKELLEENGIIFTIVSTREHLIRQLILNRPDILLLNEKINGDDGIKTCREIKQASEFKSLQTILTLNNFENLKLYQSSLANDYIIKPFSIELLIEKIKSLMKSVNLSN